MISSKLILFSILGLNVILVIFFGVTQHSPSNPNIFLSQIQEENPSHFDDPQIALKILKQLDIFEAVGDKSIKGAKYTHNAGGLTGKKTYCDEHREYFVNNTQEFLEGKNFATNYWKLHKLRTQVIPSMEGAQDLYPGVHPNIRNANDKYEMRTDINIFVSYDLYYYQRQIGKQFSCLSQASNHIPGHDKMYRKDKVGQSLVDYAQKYEKRPHCFNYDKWFPKTWVLQKRDQCLEFFEEFLSPRYQELKAERNVVYFRKIGANVHEGKGVFPVNDQEELHIKLLYQNGAACGKVHDNNLIQYNVYNLLLLENRKFGFRSFLLIASTNPLIAYYHDGYARLSMNEYDPNSKEIKTFVTNIGVNLKEARKGTVYQNMTSAEINEHTFWSMEDFQDYIIENKIINESNYLDNTLRPEFKKVMIHLLRMAQTGFFKKSSVFEIFGLDFVMDRDLNLWFIEANSMPLVDGFSKGSTVLLNRLLVDTYEIVFGLIKSRMKRVIKYVNMLSKNVAGDFEELSDLEKRQEEFRELTKNYFEPEFEPSPENTYSRIVYERETGVERYSGLLSEDCL